MIRNRRPAVLALAVGAALAVGVTAAWAGFPNFKLADSTFVAGTTTKGGGKTTTPALTTLAAAESGGNSSSATIYVHFSATGVTGKTEFVAFVSGEQTWACANNGGGFPADPKKVETPIKMFGDVLPLDTRNGKVVYSGDGLFITIDPPGADVLSCPTGQTALLVVLQLNELLIRVVGDDVNKQDVEPPTGPEWTGNLYMRPGYPR